VQEAKIPFSSKVIPVRAGTARRVSLQEATTVLEQANARGLVHLTVYNPEQ
jgi:hypothetical protein